MIRATGYPSLGELINAAVPAGIRMDTALSLLAEAREDLAPLGKSVHSDALAQITWFLAGLLEKCRR